jgi:hypothetical protein
MYQLFDPKVLPSVVQIVLSEVDAAIRPMNNMTIIEWSKKDDMLKELAGTLTSRVSEFKVDFAYPDKVLRKVKLKEVWSSLLENEKERCLKQHFLDGPLGNAIRPDEDEEEDLLEYSNNFGGLAARITERIVRPLLIKYNGQKEAMFNIYVNRHMTESEFPNNQLSFNLATNMIEVGIKSELSYLYAFLHVLENNDDWTLLGFETPKYPWN